ncbi:MAG TPA: photosystem reaction center subunit H [Thermoplasmatales archaeon]|nr:photosystem reaction center subunit H [Thermoplasmatales archaeon]
MNVTDFINLPVYTNKGIYVGEVRNVLIDIEERCIAKLILTETNKELVEDGMDVAVPYRWVSAVGDIIILSYFPERVEIPREEEIEEEEGGKK